MKTVLVVEDNTLNRKLFCDILEYMGHRVVSTSEGLDVIQLALDENPDLIIMDVHIPNISGLELTRLIKLDSELKKVPLIAVTAYAMKHELDLVRQSGCDGFLVKPISVNEFRNTVKGFLGDVS